ncbi:outer membrane lipoprotein-sorting protein [Amycolatopsis bartoniae]|uniref:Membrane protein n=1 Tax=Amycolatopsis bartoniae TaxID=941986 RepID=A0A8H9ISB8_9PSEU|nr:sigma-E factor regulatory protein RseB domain-containing protein [Amycolatopsis bartoniae]MBB2934600.1 outer membrane lipoprotein-sorting protein [Amycolatopsis bartoniae]TVT06924.1 outer membrane lipoprotein carrier protein LolA [Amycolatopsis bartoniae]GHF46184.1 membrane protein [Amycolatopsis bartoniae]
MRTKTKAITAAVTGSALGAAGLAWLAMPASAGEAPELPPIGAEELVQSVMATKTPALDGTVQVENNLGLPTTALPGGMSLNLDAAHVYNDGNGNAKLSIEQGANDTTVVRNGTTVWTYNSAKNTATKTTVTDEQPPAQIPSDPAAAATQLMAKVRESSTVAVEGTARVAGRAAYELVLTPKPTEHTVLREVRIAVDAEKRVPLRLAVLAYGSADPVLQVGFSDIEFASQPASEFQFTPPQGAKVTEEQAQLPKRPETADSVEVVGDGWDSVVTGTFPTDALTPKQGPKHGGADANPQQLLSRFGKPVSGAFGNGWVISTKAGSALITADGRFAAGAVTEQTLVDALSAK